MIKIYQPVFFDVDINGKIVVVSHASTHLISLLIQQIIIDIVVEYVFPIMRREI
jgi:hypothetical protein